MSYDPYNQQQMPNMGGYAAYDEPYKDYNAPRFPSGGNTTIRVENITFVPTGTYGQQWRRPWVTKYTKENANSVHEVVAAAYQQHQVAKANGTLAPEAKYTVDPLSLAGVSSSFLSPSAVAESRAQANLMGGWGEQHGRFVANIWVQRHQAITPTRYLLIGYTNWVGFSEQGHVSPDMELNINTIFEVRDVEVNYGYGPKIESQLIQVNQVLVDQQFQSPDTAETIRIRPYEVAVSLARMSDPLLQQQGVTAVDTRDIQNGTPQLSNQHHTNPNDYMASIISGLVNGHNLARQTGRSGAQEPYHMAARELRDPSVNQDPFIMAISRAVGNGTISSTFTWRDLLRLDPNAERDDVCFIQWRKMSDFRNVKGENMHAAGSSVEWNAQDFSTPIAAQMCQMVPSMMIDLGLRRVEIFASNLQGNAHAICVASNGWGLAAGANMTPQMQALGTMFYQQCVMPNTFNGNILYEISLTADLYGEIVVKVRFDAQPEAVYVLPAYCSSASSPVITTRRDTLDNLASAFHNLQQEVLPANPVRPLIHDLQMGGTTTGRRY